jgi:hypothetical protein
MGVGFADNGPAARDALGTFCPICWSRSPDRYQWYLFARAIGGGGIFVAPREFSITVRILFSILLLGASGDARAQTPSGEVPITVRGEAPKEAHTVCRKEAVTGSKLERRVCRTVAQRESTEREAQATLEAIRQDADTEAYARNTRNRR